MLTWHDLAGSKAAQFITKTVSFTSAGMACVARSVFCNFSIFHWLLADSLDLFPFSAFPPCVSRILPHPIFFWTMGHHQRSSEEGKCMHGGRGLCLIHGHTITTLKINGKSCLRRFNILRNFFQTKLFWCLSVKKYRSFAPRWETREAKK